MHVPPGSISSDSPALTAWVEQLCGGMPRSGFAQPNEPMIATPAAKMRRIILIRLSAGVGPSMLVDGLIANDRAPEVRVGRQSCGRRRKCGDGESVRPRGLLLRLTQPRDDLVRAKAGAVVVDLRGEYQLVGAGARDQTLEACAHGVGGADGGAGEDAVEHRGVVGGEA